MTRRDNVIHGDFSSAEFRADLCRHCGKLCEHQFNLPSGRWHWTCWRLAHPNLPKCTEPQLVEKKKGEE